MVFFERLTSGKGTKIEVHFESEEDKSDLKKNGSHHQFQERMREHINSGF